MISPVNQLQIFPSSLSKSKEGKLSSESQKLDQKQFKQLLNEGVDRFEKTEAPFADAIESEVDQSLQLASLIGGTQSALPTESQLTLKNLNNLQVPQNLILSNAQGQVDADLISAEPQGQSKIDLTGLKSSVAPINPQNLIFNAQQANLINNSSGVAKGFTDQHDLVVSMAKSRNQSSLPDYLSNKNSVDSYNAQPFASPMSSVVAPISAPVMQASEFVLKDGFGKDDVVIEDISADQASSSILGNTEQEKSKDNKAMSGSDFLLLKQAAKPQMLNPLAAEASSHSANKSLVLNADTQPVLNRVKMNESFEPKSDQIFSKSKNSSEPSLPLINHASQVKAQIPSFALTGHVTQGALAQNRFSHESILELSKQIQQVKTFGSGNGNVKIKLNPESLGEISLNVETRGNAVGIRVQAHDENTRHLLEASLNDLKDSLSSKQLHLAKIEFVQPSQHQGSILDASQDYRQAMGGLDLKYNQENAFSNYQGNQEQRNRSDDWSSDVASSVRGSTGRSMPGLSNQYRARQADLGRLDVMA